jgi:hypothetical protein
MTYKVAAEIERGQWSCIYIFIAILHPDKIFLHRYLKQYNSRDSKPNTKLTLHQLKHINKSSCLTLGMFISNHYICIGSVLMEFDRRKDLGDQAKEKITPDSQKSTLDQAKEQASGLYDRAAGSVQPSDQKSGTQKVGDSLRSGTDDASNQSKGFVQSAQDTASSAAQSVGDTLSGVTGQKK